MQGVQRCDIVEVFAEQQYRRRQFHLKLVLKQFTVSADQAVRRQIYSLKDQLPSEPDDTSIRAKLIELRALCV